MSRTRDSLNCNQPGNECQENDEALIYMDRPRLRLKHTNTSTQNLNEMFVWSYNILPIRPINFPLPEFPAARREKSPTPAVVGCPPAPLTGVSADAGCPLRWHA